MTDLEEKQMTEAYKALDSYHEEISNNIRDTLMNISKKIGVSYSYLRADFDDLMEDCGITGKLEIVSNPEGEKQDDYYEFFKEIYVDQWSVGDSGDSYEGSIFGKFSKTKWLKIPYEC